MQGPNEEDDNAVVPDPKAAGSGDFVEEATGGLATTGDVARTAGRKVVSRTLGTAGEGVYTAAEAIFVAPNVDAIIAEVATRTGQTLESAAASSDLLQWISQQGFDAGGEAIGGLASWAPEVAGGYLGNAIVPIAGGFVGAKVGQAFGEAVAPEFQGEKTDEAIARDAAQMVSMLYESVQKKQVKLRESAKQKHAKREPVDPVEAYVLSLSKEQFLEMYRQVCAGDAMFQECLQTKDVQGMEQLLRDHVEMNNRNLEDKAAALGIDIHRVEDLATEIADRMSVPDPKTGKLLHPATLLLNNDLIADAGTNHEVKKSPRGELRYVADDADLDDPLLSPMLPGRPGGKSRFTPN